MNDGQSFIDHMTTWNTDRGIFRPYTGRTTIRDALVLGRTGGGWLWGTGIDRNDVTNNMTYENVQVRGWEVGISVPVNRSTTIRDGVFQKGAEHRDRSGSRHAPHGQHRRQPDVHADHGR